MNLQDLYLHFGNATRAARALGITRQAFYLWDQRGFIPLSRQKQIEKFTSGKLKADKEIHDEIDDKVIYLPMYRYYSDDYGMCNVRSLSFKPNHVPRITFYPRLKPTLSFCSFQLNRLMMALKFRDANDQVLYEKDIVLIDNKKHEIDNIYDISCQNLDKFLIIGNKWEGVKDGY